MKSLLKHNENSRPTWAPRIITLLITFLAILYFYPHSEEDNLYQFKTGQIWDHSDIILRDSLILAPDSAKIVRITDSVRNNFVNVYIPINADELAPKRISETVSSKLSDVFRFSEPGSSWGLLLPTKCQTAIALVSEYLTEAYNGKVVEVPEGAVKPEKMALSGGSALTGDIYSTQEIRERISRYFKEQNIATEAQALEAITPLIRPNVALNTEKSKERFDAELGMELEKATPVYLPGYRVVARGDVVTPQQAELISLYTQQQIESGDAHKRSFTLTLIGQSVYILLLLLVLVVYMNYFAPRVWKENRNFIFIVSLVGLFVVLSALANKLLVLGLYIIPIVSVPILVQVFFHGRMALWTGLVTALLCAGMTTSGMQYTLIEFLGIMTAVFSLRDLAKRSQLLRTSLYVGAAYIIMYVCYELLTTGNFDGLMWRMIAILGINAVLTSVCYVLMFGVERIFGFISNVTLVELTDVNSPLLRALSDECPGTFNHVMAVSNLAYDGARQIGANALLTRAGAMYHDIGKLANPTFFTENQHGVNPHDGLSPKQSAQIIIDHVNEGLRRAEKAGLPKIIRNFISEHHGAGQAKYFYFTYCKQHPDEEVDPVPFTYPGPNPQSRETSVLMMADAVEAASRSLKEHSPQAISDLVNKIIDGQISDGLHNESPLSFHDIKTIKEVFIRRLMTMYHSRIAYPDDPNKKKNSGAPAQQNEPRAASPAKPENAPIEKADDENTVIMIDLNDEGRDSQRRFNSDPERTNNI